MAFEPAPTPKRSSSTSVRETGRIATSEQSSLERWADYALRLTALAERDPILLVARHELFWTLIAGEASAPVGRRVRELAKTVAHRARTDLPSTGCDVVAVVDSPRDILSDSVAPVVDRLDRRGLSVAVVTTKGAAAALTGIEQPVVVVRQPFRRGEPRARRRLFDDLRRALPDSVSPGDWPVFDGLIANVASLQQEVDRVLEHLRPRAVVLARDQPVFAAAFCVSARRIGIPTLSLQHGMVNAFDVPLMADRYAAWGPISRDQLVDSGAEPDRVVLAGSPRHDSVAISPPPARERLRHGWEVDQQLVLTFFSGGHAGRITGDAARDGCVAWLEKATAELAGRVRILVKLHPDEDGRLYTGTSAFRVLGPNVPLSDVFAVSDVVGSLCSTTLQEALLYGKPALQFLADGWPEVTDAWRRGIALRVQSADHLVARLQELCDEREHRRVTEELTQQSTRAFSHVGGAADAVTAEIVAMVGPRPNC